jgi:hypothetical protein
MLFDWLLVGQILRANPASAMSAASATVRYIIL